MPADTRLKEEVAVLREEEEERRKAQLQEQVVSETGDGWLTCVSGNATLLKQRSSRKQVPTYRLNTMKISKSSRHSMMLNMV